jgi:hypothetical protein
MTDNSPAEKEDVVKVIANALAKTALFLILLNAINIMVEIFKVEKGASISIAFTNGYFMLNNNTIGFHIFSNVLVFLVLFFIILNYGGRKN